MKKRIADIVTRFRAEGLGPVRAALKEVSAAARRTRAETSRAGDGIGDGVERRKRGVLRAFRDLSVGGVRAFRDVARAGESAMAGIARAASRTAAGVLSGFKSAAAGVAKLAFNPVSLIGGAAGLAGYGAYKLSPLLTGGFALGGAGLAGALSVQDALGIKGITDATGVTPEVAAQWQLMANRLGVSTEEIGGTLSGLKAKMLEALDPTSDVAKQFAVLGVSVRDGSGHLRTASQVMFDLADATKGLNDQQRNYLIGQFVGEDMAARLSPLLRQMGTEREKLLAEFEQNKADGLFASQEQIDRQFKFVGKLADILLPLRALARELFLTFEPFFSMVLEKLTVLFRNPGERARIINDWFVKPFLVGFQLLNDLLRVFAGVDLWRMLSGNEGPTPIVNEWTVAFRDFLTEAWRVAKGLGALFLGVGDAILDVAHAVDALVLRMTGVSLSQWFDTTAVRDVSAFMADLGRTFAQVFDARPVMDFSGYETAWGLAVARMTQQAREMAVSIYETVAGAWGYVRTAWQEYSDSVASDTGLQGVETTLGQIMVMARAVVDYLVALPDALNKVFAQGETAPAGFERLDSLKVTLDGLSKILVPIYKAFDELSRSLFGVNAAALLITGGAVSRALRIFAGFGLGTVATAGLSGLATLLTGLAGPMGAVALAIGATGAGIYLLYNLITDFTGNVEQLVGLISEAAKLLPYLTGGQYLGSEASAQVTKDMDGQFLASGGPKAGARDRYARQMRANAAEPVGDRTEIADYLRASDARRAAMANGTATGEWHPWGDDGKVQPATQATAPIGKVDVTATGRPIVLNLPDGRSVTTVAPPDQADALLSAYGNRLGGR